MTDVLTVRLGKDIFTGGGPYSSLSDNEKDELCEMFWNQLEDSGAIPTQGYRLQAAQEGFVIIGGHARIDQVKLRAILDEYSDYDWSIHRSAI